MLRRNIRLFLLQRFVRRTFSVGSKIGKRTPLMFELPDVPKLFTRADFDFLVPSSAKRAFRL